MLGNNQNPSWWGWSAVKLMLRAGLLLLPLTVTADDAAEWFERRIRPVLVESCVQCHGEAKAEAGVRLDSRKALQGSAAADLVAPGDPNQSGLLDVIERSHGEVELTPEDPLPGRVVEAFERWIREGAVWPEPEANEGGHDSPGREGLPKDWAFDPPGDPVPPADPTGWAETPIDQFIAAKLREKGLKPVEPADRRTLIRRAYLDLIGLPPPPEAVTAFVQDDSPDAFAKVVDDLLASPRYGERWGRHWLDLARYADTSGDASDTPVPEARLYRDYVIDSFNEDIPYDQFIVEQIAGDLLARKNGDSRWRERMIATGFIALSRQFGNRAYADRHMIIENTLNTIGKSMLGMSLACARCHDHKFDPISQEDYYSLYGYFQSTQYPHAGTEHTPARTNFVPLTQDEDRLREYLEWDDERFELTTDLKRGRGDSEEIKARLEELESERPDVELAWAVIDDPEGVGDAKLQQGGDPHKKKQEVPRGFIDRITSSDPEIPEGESGRMQLAEWIASPDHPLTARVMANRVWQYHFGKGLVPTSSTFGAQGKKPTHPGLLDWLARRFVKDGWSLKTLHRRMMLSKTYQLSSRASHEEAREIDPANQWYWHYPRRRLEAEAIRDAILSVGGELDLSRPESHPFPEPRRWGRVRFTQHHPFTEDYDHNHRAVYLMSRRLGTHPFMTLFNGPDTNESTARREVSTVPLQALFWMNSSFMEEQARAFAQRLRTESSEISEQIDRAYRLALSRPPTPSERKEAKEYLHRYQDKLNGELSEEARLREAWTSLSRVLMSSNEFLYLE